MFDTLFASLGIAFILFFVSILVAWPVNFYKLTQCDFDGNGNHKNEIIHAVGLVPIFAPVTVWFPTDSSDPQDTPNQ